MKLSELMKKEIDGVDDAYLLECADSSLDPSSSNIRIEKEVTLMYTLKKIATVAASVMLAVAAILSFVLIRSSLEVAPGDTPADTNGSDVTETAENTEPVEDNEQYSTYSYETREEYGRIMGNIRAVYKDFVFYIDGIKDIKYINVQNETLDSKSVFDGMENKKDFHVSDKIHIMFVEVDQYASERNDGWPVLIIGFQYKNKDFNPEYPGCCFVSYDMKTKTVKKLATDLGESISNFVIYGEYIFATCSPSTLGSKHDIYRIAIDGSETIKLDNPNGAYNALADVDDKYVYYYHDPDTIYRTTHDFKEISEVHVSSSVFGYGDHLYTLGGMTEVDLDGETRWSYDLWKMDRDDTTEHEVVVENIVGLFRAANKLYYSKVEPTYYGGKLCISKNMIYSYDLTTDEETVIVDLTDIDKVINVVACCEKSILIEMKEYHPSGWTEYVDGAQVIHGTSVLAGIDTYHYDIETGLLTKVISYYETASGTWKME